MSEENIELWALNDIVDMKLSALRVACRTVKDMSMKLSSSTRQFEGTTHSQIYAKYRPIAPSSILDHILAWSEEEEGGGLGARFALDVGWYSNNARNQRDNFQNAQSIWDEAMQVIAAA